MEKLLLVTSAFLNVRTDRPSDYYVVPLQLFLSRLNGTYPVVLFTNEPHWFRGYDRVKIIVTEPEDIVRATFHRDIGAEYRLLNQGVQTAQGTMPRLISVYLSKLPAMASIADLADILVWFDAGHTVSYQCGHDFSRFTPDLVQVPDNSFGEKIALELPIVAHEAKRDNSKAYFHTWPGEMVNYARELGKCETELLSFIAATFLTLKSAIVPELLEGYKRWVLRLLQDKKQNWIEENAYTLLAWERRDFKFRTYSEYSSIFQCV